MSEKRAERVTRNEWASGEKRVFEHDERLLAPLARAGSCRCDKRCKSEFSPAELQNTGSWKEIAASGPGRVSEIDIQ
ncbi:hypothetical protein MSG28_001834 [Choristoneura fumiferana]|uniref:Uncharacterized protein n=1 Tax=Choristoneura fumiferana TaxID=7141 RepID=A0ACC0KWF9_CHOFU|nr:hypothetical protein MSG28_001834 [Choristoneura fumiferana]